MFGHDDRIRRDRGHMFLECAECGRETVGWNLVGEVNPKRERYRDAQAVVRFVHKRADAGVDRMSRVARELLRSASSRRAA